MLKRIIFLIALVILGAGILAAPAILSGSKVSGEPAVYASPIQAGCYIAGPSDCRIHADPFTINVTAATKLVTFKLVATQDGTGPQTTVYHFKTDQSNAVPFSGTTYTPSLVTQDFAATCGKSYTLSLQGSDSGNAALYNLGMTSVFTCPSKMP